MTEVINRELPYFGEEGLNCSESSLRLLIERGVVDIPMDSVKLMTGLGGGMSCGGPCGAVVGCTAAIGSVAGRFDPADISYMPTIEARREFMKRFHDKYGAVTCEQLMFGVDKASVEMQKKCSGFVLGAVDIATEIIEELKAKQK